MAVFRGHSLVDAIIEIGNQWLPPKQALEWFRHPDSVIVGQRFSTACYIRESFPATLYLALKYSQDIESGLVANTNLGGDNCHRGAVLGALLGGGERLH
jgi:ADP-ribosyl-[dinitrogen reductase] hydrolase